MMILSLNGEVGEDFTSASVQRELTGGGPVRVILNSGGGFAMEGVAIHNVLVDHDGPVDIEVIGIAASAASLIAMAGRKITMRAGAVLMIHDPSVATLGNAADHTKSIEMLETIAGTFAEIYAARSGKSAAECRRLMKDETWYDGEAAVAAGFATDSSRRHAVAFAKYDYAEYRRSTEAFASVERKRAEMALDPRAIEIAMQRWGEVTALPGFRDCEAMAALMFKHNQPVATIAGALAAGMQVAARHAKRPEPVEPPDGYRCAGAFLHGGRARSAEHSWAKVIERHNRR